MTGIGAAIFLEPTDAVRAFEARGRVIPTVRWSEMMHENHAVAFTVAKIARLDLLNAIYTSLDDVIRNGGTFEGWKKNMLPELKKAGWWGVVQDRDLTGTDRPIVVNERRLRTIYNTNVRMSLSAGHWTRVQRQKGELPFLRYLSSSSEHKRPLHKQWYGVILPVDDPWWATHFPPNGWGCKCSFEQVSAARMARKGWKITPPDTIAGAGVMTPFHAASGQTVDVPAGIDPGFGYNPGTAMRTIAEKTTRSMVQAVGAGNTHGADMTLREIIDGPVLPYFLEMPDGDFPIAILTAEQMVSIDAISQIVVLPAGVMRKQKGETPDVSAGHPELDLHSYRLLPNIIRRALVIARQGEDRLIFFADEAGNIWKAVVRQDAGSLHPAVVSFHKSGLRKIRSETRNLDILVDRR